MQMNSEQIQKAFALAHNGAENTDLDKGMRAILREIARLIWAAAGKAKPVKEGMPQWR